MPRLGLFTVLIESARFMTKHAISVMVSVLNLASRPLFAFAQKETRELNTLLRKHFATFCNCLLDPKRKCHVDHNTCSSHLARCKSQQLRAHVTAAANITCFSLLMKCRSISRTASSFASGTHSTACLFNEKHLRSAGSLQHFADDPRARREPRCDAFHRHLIIFDAGSTDFRIEEL